MSTKIVLPPGSVLAPRPVFPPSFWGNSQRCDVIDLNPSFWDWISLRSSKFRVPRVSGIFEETEPSESLISRLEAANRQHLLLAEWYCTPFSILGVGPTFSTISGNSALIDNVQAGVSGKLLLDFVARCFDGTDPRVKYAVVVRNESERWAARVISEFLNCRNPGMCAIEDLPLLLEDIAIEKDADVEEPSCRDSRDLAVSIGRFQNDSVSTVLGRDSLEFAVSWMRWSCSDAGVSTRIRIQLSLQESIGPRIASIPAGDSAAMPVVVLGYSLRLCDINSWICWSSQNAKLDPLGSIVVVDLSLLDENTELKAEFRRNVVRLKTYCSALGYILSVSFAGTLSKCCLPPCLREISASSIVGNVLRVARELVVVLSDDPRSCPALRDVASFMYWANNPYRWITHCRLFSRPLRNPSLLDKCGLRYIDLRSLGWVGDELIPSDSVIVSIARLLVFSAGGRHGYRDAGEAVAVGTFGAGVESRWICHELECLRVDIRAALCRGGYTAIELACWGHMKFELIHPFKDGNGRVGRAILCFAISRIIGGHWLDLYERLDAAKDRYRRVLRAAQEVGEVGGFLELIGDLVAIPAASFRGSAGGGVPFRLNPLYVM